MAGEQRTSPEFTGMALEATVRLGDGMEREREARRRRFTRSEMVRRRRAAW